uniref:Uncharacterized protein n=1 Tax=Anopheles atroparvus TaxID=41427 RepID=A0A182IZG8_ANOAO
MKCAVVLLVSLFALLITGVRSAPQRGIDFLPGDEEVQAIVKPIAGDSDVPEQQRQLGPDEDDATDEQQQQQQEQEQPEVPATVDPVEDEQQTEEDPAEEVTESDDDEPIDDPIDDQFTEENEEDVFDPVTDQPEDTVQNSTSKNDLPSQTGSATTPSQEDANPAKDTSSTPNNSDPVVDYSSEERLTTDPIVVEEPSSTESSEDSNRFAEDVNSLADDSTNQVKYGLEDNQDQPEPQVKPTPQPNLTPKTPVPYVPQHSTTERPPVPAEPSSEDYDSKSLESHEDEDQVQLKVGPNDQFRTLPPWFGSTRLADYDQWQQQGSSFPQRSNWQPRHYQSNSFDGFHGHGFHRSSWH